MINTELCSQSASLVEKPDTSVRPSVQMRYMKEGMRDNLAHDQLGHTGMVSCKVCSVCMSMVVVKPSTCDTFRKKGHPTWRCILTASGPSESQSIQVQDPLSLSTVDKDRSGLQQSSFCKHLEQ